MAEDYIISESLLKYQSTLDPIKKRCYFLKHVKDYNKDMKNYIQLTLITRSLEAKMSVEPTLQIDEDVLAKWREIGPLDLLVLI